MGSGTGERGWDEKGWRFWHCCAVTGSGDWKWSESSSLLALNLSLDRGFSRAQKQVGAARSRRK